MRDLDRWISAGDYLLPLSVANIVPHGLQVEAPQVVFYAFVEILATKQI